MVDIASTTGYESKFTTAGNWKQDIKNTLVYEIPRNSLDREQSFKSISIELTLQTPTK